MAIGKLQVFPKLRAMLEDSSYIFLPDTKNIVEDHLSLQKETDRDIPDIVDLKKHSWIRIDLTVNITETKENIPSFSRKIHRPPGK